MHKMITFENAMRTLDQPAICDLSTKSLSRTDVVNLILQRSEIIRDQNQHNKYIKAWTAGDDRPLLDLIQRLGTDILVRRAAAFIYLEYLELRPIFEAKTPEAIADIGCGYALFDLFLAHDYASQLYLIDLETNANRHFGFEAEGAAYSSLTSARNLLLDNGVAPKSIQTLNPKTDDVSTLRDLDFAFSFISCGFHYPWHTYQQFFEQSVIDEGRVIIDIRARTLGPSLQELSELGYVRIVEKAANNSAYRVMIAKSQSAA